MEGISKKVYLELKTPDEEDSRSGQQRIRDGLADHGIRAELTAGALRQLYPLCSSAGWKVTVSLAWDGAGWKAVKLEAGNTAERHYGLAVDLGSTTVGARLVSCTDGRVIAEAGCYNRQIRYGADILTRIFSCKDNPAALEEMRKAAVASILCCMEELEGKSGISSEECIQMVLSGNTTMIHFLLGLDAFCVFASPYAVHADRPGFLPARELEIPVPGYVYCCPARSNYLGGDILSGLAATEIYREEEICVFFDIGTNGELVVGNRDFLLCGAGAAGPALEGGSVRTGMRASDGAVDSVRLEEGRLQVHVIGGGKAEGICGSGIVDLLAELFLNGWINIRGTLDPEKSPLIRETDGMYGVEYAPGLIFWQQDIDEFLKTKAAAYTMVEFMLRESGIALEDTAKFYVAGAFGKYVSKESAITIGLYPDMDRDKLIQAGNTSLEGAVKILLDRTIPEQLEEILEKMIYIQFGAVDDFLHMMTAAQALPHTDLSRYPSVRKKLAEKQTFRTDEW
jgi:uncharacterized 2Fe-2S/4Fe-4S cluster protein (DUF4445 family)